MLGYMTVNTLFGIVSILGGTLTLASWYHFILIFMFIIIGTTYQLTVKIRKRKYTPMRPYEKTRQLGTMIISLAIFLFSAHWFYQNQQLTQENPLTYLCLFFGLLSAYIQNYVLKSAHPTPTATTAITGIYSMIFVHLANFIVERSPKDYDLMKHHLLVYFHFVLGVVAMYFMIQYIDFLSLLLPLLILTIMLAKFYHKKI